jgi:hypothetical protein
LIRELTAFTPYASGLAAEIGLGYIIFSELVRLSSAESVEVSIPWAFELSEA